MIVPQFWAESRLQQRQAGKQVTLRRYGWSDISQEDAQVHAEQRVQEAMARVLAGEDLHRRERKVPYNGADGLPIREEILGRHGNVVLTRNAYGAHCLNTPDVLFVDIDFPEDPSFLFMLTVFAVFVLLACGIAWQFGSVKLGLLLVALALLGSGALSGLLFRALQQVQGGAEKIVCRRVEAFVAAHPGWALRLYRTPAGVRVLVTHQTFQPAASEVAECFAALRADPLYARMCRNQNCFRARLTAKPWRIGMDGHLRPRPGVWPVAGERQALRQAWIAGYEGAASRHAACRFIASLGSGTVDAAVAPVLQLHDELAGAHSSLPIA